MNILEFLSSNGIIVGEENFPKENRKNNILDVDNQISLIIEVHKILEGKKNNIIPKVFLKYLRCLKKARSIIS